MPFWKFVTKNALFGWYWARSLKKLLWDLKSAPLNMSSCKILWRNKNSYFETKNNIFGYFWPRMPYFDISGQEFWKNYCEIWNQHPSICLIAKYFEIMEMPKFATKSALFGYSWTGIWKQYCHMWNQHPQICLIAKFCWKAKMPKFGTKNALFGSFWARILKNYSHIWNEHPQIYEKWVFNSYNEFWYRVRFF